MASTATRASWRSQEQCLADINMTDLQEQTRLFAALAEGGSVPCRSRLPSGARVYGMTTTASGSTGSELPEGDPMTDESPAPEAEPVPVPAASGCRPGYRRARPCQRAGACRRIYASG